MIIEVNYLIKIYYFVYRKESENMLKKRWIVPIILIMVLVLTACADNPQDKEQNPIKQETEEDIRDTNNNDDDNTEVKSEGQEVSLEEAFDIFSEKYPNIKVQKVELDRSDGEYFYKIKGYDESKKYKIKVRLEDGKVTSEEKSEDDNEVVDIGITKEDLQKVQSFVDKSLDDAGDNYKLYEWELKSKRGQIRIEVEVVNENNDDIEYEYNVETGELIEKD